MYRIIIGILLLILLAGCDMNNASCSGVYTLTTGGRYEPHMKVARAYPLCPTKSSNREKYRFIWLRSHDNPIIVSLIKEGTMIEVSAIRLDGTGGGNPGEMIETRMNLIPQDDFNHFRSLIDQMNFWSLKSLDQLVGEGSAKVGQDGARWVLEGAKEDVAHAADRWSDVDGPFREAALWLLEKSGINPNGEVY